MKSRAWPSWLLHALQLVAIAAVYYGTVMFGRILASGELFHPIWPVAGITVAAVLLFGYRIWPGIAVGAFVESLLYLLSQGSSMGVSLPVSAGIATGHTAEAILGAYLVRRFIGSRMPFDRIGGTIRFILLVVPIAPVASVVLGITSLCIGGIADWGDYVRLGWVWWIGNALGILLVTPLLLVWILKWNERPARSRLTEAITVYGPIAAGVLFLGLRLPGDTVAMLHPEHLALPLIILVTFRLGLHGTVSAMSITAVVALWHTSTGHGPFVTASLSTQVMLLQIHMGLTAVTSLILASVLTEHQETIDELHVSRNQVAHSYDLLLSLGEVAQKIQRARSPQAVYRILGEQITRLGHYAIIYLLEGEELLRIAHLTLAPTMLRTMEKLTGLTMETFRLSLEPGNFFHQIVREERPAFHDQADALIAKSFPPSMRSIAPKVVKLLGVKQVIGVPLKFNGKVQGVLSVAGIGLTEADLPGMMILANQAVTALENAQLYETVQRREAELRQLFTSAREAMLVFDPEGIILSANPAAAAMVKYETPEDLVGVPLSRLCPDRACQKEVFRKLKRQGYVEDYELTFIRSDGVAVHVLGSITAQGDENGNWWRIEAMFTDITKRKQAESELRDHQNRLEQRVEARTRELQQSEQRFRTLADSAADPIYLVDLKGRLLDVNQQACRTLGYTREQLLQMSLAEVNIQYQQDKLSALLREQWITLKAGEQLTLEGLHRRKDGSTFPVELKLAAVEKDGQELILAIARDISVRKEAEEELKRAKEAAEQTNQAKSDFLANMSHEIRTPMNAIIGMAHLALQTGLSSKQQDYLSKIHSSAHALLEIINDILDFSKIEAGKLTMEGVTFNLEEILKDTSDMLLPTAHDKGLAFTLKLSPELPSWLVGDPLRLRQVLINLMSNAIKFTKSGKILVSADVMTEDSEHVTIRFSVQDTGIGMTQAQVERLFEPFAQGDTSMTRQYGGTGLGLSISQQIVHMMGGEIEVESEPGRGSTFSFTVTLMRPEAASKNSPSPVVRLHGGADSQQGHAPVNLSGVRVLLAEDNEINQQVARGLIELTGASVTAVENGRSAVQRLQEEKFDVVLMDIQMPEMDGYTATHQIRSRPELQTLPIIAMTAHAMNEHREEALRAGMNDYVSKPIDPQSLWDTLERWVVPRGATVLTSSERDDTPGASLLPDLPGINTQSVLSRLNGNRELLRNLLHKFSTDRAGMVEEIAAALENEDRERARQLAHALKGIAGNIGADTLHAALIDLETAIQHEAREEWTSMLTRMRQLQEEVLASIALFERSCPEEDSRDKRPATEFDRDKLLLHLQELRSLLEQDDFGAVDYLKSLTEELEASPLQGEIHQLKQLVGRYDFENALRLLEHLKF